MIQMQGENVQQSVSVVREQRLQRFSKAAIEYQKKKDLHRVALCMQVIYNEKLYLEAGHANIYELGKSVLGTTRATTSNYLTVAKKFLDSNSGKSIFADGSRDFGYTQLVEMKKLSVDDAKELVKSGAINFDSTAKEIKQTVAEFVTMQKKDAEKLKEESLNPLKDAYEDFHKAFNELQERVTDEAGKALLQKIMDSVVVLYNENDRLWN